MLKGRDMPQQLWLPSRSGEQRLSDIQNTRDHRNISIDKVGVKNIRYPITVLDRTHGRQQTVANINMYVNLPKHFKGTHMSRFIEILNEYHGEIHIRNFATILETMKNRLQAESAHLEITFPYFIEKKSPVSNASGLMEYGCRLRGSLSAEDGHDLVAEISVPITTVSTLAVSTMADLVNTLDLEAALISLWTHLQLSRYPHTRAQPILLNVPGVCGEPGDYRRDCFHRMFLLLT